MLAYPAPGGAEGPAALAYDPVARYPTACVTETLAVTAHAGPLPIDRTLLLALVRDSLRTRWTYVFETLRSPDQLYAYEDARGAGSVDDPVDRRNVWAIALVIIRYMALKTDQLGPSPEYGRLAVITDFIRKLRTRLLQTRVEASSSHNATCEKRVYHALTQLSTAMRLAVLSATNGVAVDLNDARSSEY